MGLQVPLHQFEIRFSYLLNFPIIIKEILGPFVPLSTNLNIERENNPQSARFTLNFAKENYTISVSWDRIVFRYEGSPKDLAQNNSIFEEPFMNLFTKIKNHKEFGKITNFLSYTIYVNHTGKTKDEILEDFVKYNFIKANIDKIISSPSDIGIILQNDIDNRQTTITYGPYFGLSDLANRNATPIFSKEFEDLNTFGQMAEVKVLESTNTFSFSTYKETVKQSTDLISRLWPN